MFADLSELSVGGVVIFPPLTQSAGFLEMERAVFNFLHLFFFFFCLIEIGENWHMCFKGQWEQLEKVNIRELKKFLPRLLFKVMSRPANERHFLK